MKEAPLIRELRAIVGEGFVLHAPEDMIVFEYDGSVDRALPTAVVFPVSTEEVSRNRRDRGAQQISGHLLTGSGSSVGRRPTPAMCPLRLGYHSDTTGKAGLLAPLRLARPLRRWRPGGVRGSPMMFARWARGWMYALRKSSR